MRDVLIHSAALSFACVISYWLITHILVHILSVSREDDLLGGMWAVVATVFVYRYCYEESVRAALSRMAATSVSFALCLLYLLMFPFHLWGLGALIGIGAAVMTLIGRSDDTITTGITTAVVMVVAAISPQRAWIEPILRLLDTIVGMAVGVSAARLGLIAARPRQRAIDAMDRRPPGEAR
jgi:uncharacterized membrane protein YccC